MSDASSSAATTLSIILVAYNMQRAAPRAVASLVAPYQRNISHTDYEILVIENGSTEPLDPAAVEALGSNVRYLFLEDAPPSPARAINTAVEQARGDVIAVMIDGAHMLTPGVLCHGLDVFRSLANPVVITPAFFLGPGPQMETVAAGYSEQEEDRLLDEIAWPEDGYRLFEIGVPYRIEPGGVRPKLFWFVRQFESNCLFMRRAAFEAVGGCDERFDLPGGGILLPDLYRELARLEDAELVQLMGEASFHQVHGGISTNVSRSDQKAQWQHYLAQYKTVRGEPYEVSKKPLRYYGHMPNEACRQLMITG